MEVPKNGQVIETIPAPISGNSPAETKPMNWLDSYYDGLEFFYWEPQHFGPRTQAVEEGKQEAVKEAKQLAKIAKNSKRVDQVRKHLREMEVTLNHNIEQFFLLAPATLPNNLFRWLFDDGHQFEGDLSMQRRLQVDKDFKLANCMQPDFVFISEADVVSIEMKINSKCSVEQVLKYALLGLAIELQKGEKRHYLVLLGSGTLEDQFPEKGIKSIEGLLDTIRKRDLKSFLLNKPKAFRGEEKRLEKIVNQMHAKFLSYEDFDSFLRDKTPQPDDQSWGAEVYGKLISGLRHEFREHPSCGVATHI